jgi:hypothetical protein
MDNIMKKHLSILLFLSVFLTGCDIEASFRGAIAPIQASFQSKADQIQSYINGLAHKDVADNDPGNNTDIIGTIEDTGTLMTDVTAIQQTAFNNPHFLDLTVITPTVTGSVPITFYSSAPQPVRSCTYAMSQLEPGAGQSMSALGMVQWLALAVSLPFTLMRALTATTTYLGPLGLLLTWVTIAGLWFMAVLTLDFIVSLVRNSGGLIKLFVGVARLFK